MRRAVAADQVMVGDKAVWGYYTGHVVFVSDTVYLVKWNGWSRPAQYARAGASVLTFTREVQGGPEQELTSPRELIEGRHSYADERARMYADERARMRNLAVFVEQERTQSLMFRGDTRK